jgi:peptidoglycan/LPS O-acetylase OafA/YrhL
MIRFLLERWAFFAVPFAVWGLYVLLMYRARRRPPPRTPWTALFIAGLALVAASFIWLGLTEGFPAQGTYVAPHVVNGKIVPGTVETIR